ncbi:MAG: NRDE family protein [Spirochaetota bacterium]|nr:NRDE family protein [Spirochaetota bacterium]
MCILLIAWKTDTEYPLIVAANRDEAYARPTEPARWWPDAPRVLAGRDLKAGGTWMGVTRNGRFAALTNYWGDAKGRRRPYSYAKTGVEPPSRGALVGDFLTSVMPPEEYGRRIARSGSAYEGFNLVFGTPAGLFYCSNRDEDGRSGGRDGGGPQALPEGIHGISNALLNTPWPKVTVAKQSLEEMIAERRVNRENLFALLNRSEQKGLQQTARLTVEERRKISRASIRVFFPKFGTRASTVLLYRRDGLMSFEERTYYPPGTSRFDWKVVPDMSSL